VGAAERERLVRSVHALKPTSSFTNLDEVAKLIELLSYQLRAVYGPFAHRLTFRVYSDFESAPSLGKPKFLLADYLARRMGPGYSHIPTAGNATELTLTLQPVPDVRKTDHARPVSAGKEAVLRFLVPGASAALLALGVLVFRWLRSGYRDRSPETKPLRSLLVTESVDKDGQPPRGATEERCIQVATGVPMLFSTDATCAAYVASGVPGEAQGELFRIEPLPDGSIRIQSPHPRLTVNEEPLNADRRLTVSIREPIRIRLGPREFNIVGVFGAVAAFRRESVFDAGPLQH
jgi:hypothetical protein